MNDFLLKILIKLLAQWYFNAPLRAEESAREK